MINVSSIKDDLPLASLVLDLTSNLVAWWQRTRTQAERKDSDSQVSEQHGDTSTETVVSYEDRNN